MKVRILTGAFGEGHKSAANACKEMIRKEDPQADVLVVDVVKKLFEAQSKAVYGLFRFLVNHCANAYNLYCAATEKKTDSRVNRMLKKRMDEYLDREQPDLIIATMPIVAQYVGSYKRSHKDSPKLYTFITDIEVRPEWIAEETDCYFVGSQEVAEHLRERGVSKERIKISGIPVRQQFYESWELQNRAKHSHERRLYISNNQCCDRKKEVLIMGGGLGMIPGVEDMLTALLDAQDIKVTVLAGRNEKMKKQLETQFPAIHVIGYTEQVAVLMQQADLIVTKAGGVTMFEAIHCQTPLCVLAPFLSQEQENARFIIKHNFGMVMWDKRRKEADMILEMLRNDVALRTMKKQMAAFLSSLTPFSCCSKKDSNDWQESDGMRQRKEA